MNNLVNRSYEKLNNVRFLRELKDHGKIIRFNSTKLGIASRITLAGSLAYFSERELSPSFVGRFGFYYACLETGFNYLSNPSLKKIKSFWKNNFDYEPSREDVSGNNYLGFRITGFGIWLAYLNHSMSFTSHRTLFELLGDIHHFPQMSLEEQSGLIMFGLMLPIISKAGILFETLYRMYKSKPTSDEVKSLFKSLNKKEREEYSLARLDNPFQRSEQISRWISEGEISKALTASLGPTERDKYKGTYTTRLGIRIIMSELEDEKGNNSLENMAKILSRTIQLNSPNLINSVAEKMGVLAIEKQDPLYLAVAIKTLQDYESKRVPTYESEFVSILNKRIPETVNFRSGENRIKVFENEVLKNFLITKIFGNQTSANDSKAIRDELEKHFPDIRFPKYLGKVPHEDEIYSLWMLEHGIILDDFANTHKDKASELYKQLIRLTKQVADLSPQIFAASFCNTDIGDSILDCEDYFDPNVKNCVREIAHYCAPLSKLEQVLSLDVCGEQFFVRDDGGLTWFDIENKGLHPELRDPTTILITSRYDSPKDLIEEIEREYGLEDSVETRILLSQMTMMRTLRLQRTRVIRGSEIEERERIIARTNELLDLFQDKYYFNSRDYILARKGLDKIASSLTR